MDVEMIKPPIGDKVKVWFGAHTYTAEVIGHGRKFTRVRFRLKNGRLIERMAGVFPEGTPGSHKKDDALFATALDEPFYH